ncbi:MAG TPA: lyase family protein, partial [Gemmatimonadales bacterium]|nr:lyase family protein [Gemmatimonadales bacterium]
TLWMQDFALDVEALVQLLGNWRLRGCKGTTGTQASFLELFDGDHDKVRRLEQVLLDRLGHPRAFAVTGQTYPRKADSQVLDVLSGIAQSAAKFATDLRLLQHEGELLEPFEASQIGSSAMAYKRNPMRAERICALSRHVISLQQNTANTAATQWLERTLDDSANRRLTLPEAFLAIDSILLLVGSIASGLEVRDAVVARHVAEQMPFMATERWLMLAVQAGGDRQSLHEVIRTHSMAVSERVATGEPNDLLDRLASDPGFASVDQARLKAELDPARYVGRSPEQVGEFLVEYFDPLMVQAQPLAARVAASELRV